jgi:hypothetical protein
VAETILEIAAPPCRAEKAGTGIVVTNPGTGLRFAMTESAAAVWRDLTAGHSAESLIRLANGNTSLANSVERFVVELVDAGLVRKSALVTAPARPAELASAIADGSVLPPLGSLAA